MSWEIGGQALTSYSGGGQPIQTVGQPMTEMLLGEAEWDDDDDDDDDEDDELELAGAVDIVGARGASFLRRFMRKQKKKAKKAKAKAKAVKVQQQAHARVVTQRTPTRNREWPIGFDSETDIAGGASRTVITQPQVVFRPDRIIVPSSIASDFTIDDFKVGQKSQFISAVSIPAVTFQETAFGVRLMNDTCQVSMNLVMDVTNISLAPVQFRASAIGPIVE